MRTGKKALLTSVSKSFKHVSVFLLSIILSRYLSLDDYGSYLQVMLIANAVIYFSLMGIPSSIYYFLNRVSDVKSFLKRTFLMIHVLAIVSSFVVAFFSESISLALNNYELVEVAFVFVLFIFFQIPIKLFEPLMISTDNVMGFVKVNMFFNVLFFFIVAIPIVLYSNITYAFYALIVFFALQYFVIYFFIIKEYKALDKLIDDNQSECSIRDQLKYSIPIGASAAIAELSRIVDKIIVSGYFSPAQLAIYSRGAMEIPMLNVVINSLGNIMMPKFVESYSNGDVNKIISFWHTSTVIVAFIVYPLMCLMVMTGDLLIPLLFTDKFNGSIIIFQIYTLGLIFRITAYDSIIRAIGKTNVLLTVTVISLVVNVFFTTLLIEYIGIIGAPIATLLTIMIVRVKMLFVISKLLEINMSQVFPWKSLFNILFISLLSLLVVLPIKELQIMMFYKFMLSAFLYGLCYLLLNRIFSILEKEHIESLSSIVPKSFLFLFGNKYA